jgi:type IV pilus assembly protein PilM
VFGNLTSIFSNSEIIGLDIGSDSVKMAELSHLPTGMHLNTFGITRHSLNLDKYWNSKTLRGLATIIEDIIKKSDFTGIKTVISVKNKDVYVTTLDFDIAMDNKGIEKEIKAQAHNFLPLPPDEMRLSWSVVQSNGQNGKKKVIINALPESVIENTKNLLEHINLDGVALENQTLSQVRALVDPASQETTILMDIGGTHAIFSTIVSSSLRAASLVDTGTNKISNMLGLSLGVESDIGELFKRDLTLVDLKTLPIQIESYLTILRSELEHFIEQNIRAGQPPTQIIITGGGSYTPGLLNYLTATISLPIIIGDPLAGLKIDKEILPFISPVVNQLSTAIGLAKRNEF